MSRRIDSDGFGFLITDIAQLVRCEMDRRSGEAGIELTPGERRTLAHAARAGAVRQNVLAERMGLEAMTLSTYLDRLEARGLVERQADPTDRRAKIVRLTRLADDLLAMIEPVGETIRDDAARGIPDGDWKRLLELLRQVRENLSASKPGTARGEKTAA